MPWNQTKQIQRQLAHLEESGRPKTFNHSDLSKKKKKHPPKNCQKMNGKIEESVGEVIQFRCKNIYPTLKKNYIFVKRFDSQFGLQY